MTSSPRTMGGGTLKLEPQKGEECGIDSLPVVVVAGIFSFLEPNNGPWSLSRTCRHFWACCTWQLIVQHCNCAWKKDTNLPSLPSHSHRLFLHWAKILCQTHKEEAMDLLMKNGTVSPMVSRILLFSAIHLGDVSRVKRTLKDDHQCLVKGALRKAFVEQQLEIVALLQNDPRSRKHWHHCCRNASGKEPLAENCVVLPCLHRPCVSDISSDFWSSSDADLVCEECVDQYQCSVCGDYECLNCRLRSNETLFSDIIQKNFVRCSVCEKTVCGTPGSSNCCFQECVHCEKVLCKTCISENNRTVCVTQDVVSCETCHSSAAGTTPIAEHRMKKQRIVGKSLLHW